jgi:hypothetical protein
VGRVASNAARAASSAASDGSFRDRVRDLGGRAQLPCDERVRQRRLVDDLDGIPRRHDRARRLSVDVHPRVRILARLARMASAMFDFQHGSIMSAAG